jgi:hypothetical protein
MKVRLSSNTPASIFKKSHAPSDANDSGGILNDTGRMNDITRHELDAKLELIEARLDNRVARIESAVDGFKGEAEQLRSELGNAKWWAIGTAIAVLSIFATFMQWGLQAQKDENARFNAYMREDVKEIGSSVQDITKAVMEMRITLEQQKEKP